jgi:hypothetical protein
MNEVKIYNLACSVPPFLNNSTLSLIDVCSKFPTAGQVKYVNFSKNCKTI